MEQELNNYEQQQVKLIKEWKNTEPSVVSQGIGKVLSPYLSLLLFDDPLA